MKLIRRRSASTSPCPADESNRGCCHASEQVMLAPCLFSESPGGTSEKEHVQASHAMLQWYQPDTSDADLTSSPPSSPSRPLQAPAISPKILFRSRGSHIKSLREVPGHYPEVYRVDASRALDKDSIKHKLQATKKPMDRRQCPPRALYGLLLRSPPHPAELRRRLILLPDRLG